MNDYEVYAAFLSQSKWERERVERVGVEVIVVSETTSLPELGSSSQTWAHADRALQDLANVEASAVRSLEQRNRHPTRLELSRFAAHGVVLLPAAESSRIFDPKRDWHSWYPEFYSRYPTAQGHLTLSRPGFSKNGKQALLYYENHWRLEAGIGELVLFDYIDGNWRLTSRLALWVS